MSSEPLACLFCLSEGGYCSPGSERGWELMDVSSSAELAAAVHEMGGDLAGFLLQCWDQTYLGFIRNFMNVDELFL